MISFLNAKIQIAPQWWWGIGVVIIGGVSKILHSVFLTRRNGFKYFQDKETCELISREIKSDIKEIKTDQKEIARDIKEILKNGK